jgi:hypothetical protein
MTKLLDSEIEGLVALVLLANERGGRADVAQALRLMAGELEPDPGPEPSHFSATVAMENAAAVLGASGAAGAPEEK